MKTEIREGNYTIKASPIGKSWNEADKIQVCFILKTEKEEKSFKGIVDLFGIIKK